MYLSGHTYVNPIISMLIKAKQKRRALECSGLRFLVIDFFVSYYTQAFEGLQAII